MTVNNVTSNSGSGCSNGSLVGSLEGYVNLDIGQTKITETFSAQPSEYHFMYAYVENTTDASPFLGIGWTCTDRSLTGFTIDIDASPDTANYVFYWGIKTSYIQSA